MKLILSTTAALLIGTTGAMAQGFTGATVGLDYTDFNDVDGFSSTILFGSAEFEIANGFSVAADVSNRSYEDIDETVTNFVVHGIYAINPDFKVGAYVGRESISDFDEHIDNYGIELAYSAYGVSGEVYLGAAEVDGESIDVTTFGFSGAYAFGNGFSVLGGYDSVTVENGLDVTYSTLEIGAEYALGNGAAFYAKTGQLGLDAGGMEDDENYFAIGATFSFGPQGGTTFGPRGVYEVIPANL